MLTGHFPDGVPPDVEGGRFDLITCTESLYYFPDISRSLARLHAMPEDGGHPLIKSLNSNSTYFDAVPGGVAGRYGDNARSYPTYASHCCWLERSGFDIVNATGGMWPGPTPTGVMAKFRALEIFGRRLYPQSTGRKR